MTTVLDQLADLPADHPAQDWRTYAYMDLVEFLHGVRARNYRIMVEDGLPHLAPGEGDKGCHPSISDYWQLKRHAHALCVALSGDCPEWWSYTSGQSDVPPSIEQIPKVVDPTSADGWSFACGWCGSSANTVSDHGMPWCSTHDPEVRP